MNNALISEVLEKRNAPISYSLGAYMELEKLQNPRKVEMTEGIFEWVVCGLLRKIAMAKPSELVSEVSRVQSWYNYDNDTLQERLRLLAYWNDEYSNHIEIPYMPHHTPALERQRSKVAQKLGALSGIVFEGTGKVPLPVKGHLPKIQALVARVNELSVEACRREADNQNQTQSPEDASKETAEEKVALPGCINLPLLQFVISREHLKPEYRLAAFFEVSKEVNYEALVIEGSFSENSGSAHECVTLLALKDLARFEDPKEVKETIEKAASWVDIYDGRLIDCHIGSLSYFNKHHRKSGEITNEVFVRNERMLDALMRMDFEIKAQKTPNWQLPFERKVSTLRELNALAQARIEDADRSSMAFDIKSILGDENDLQP